MNHLRSECAGTLTVLSLKQNSAANWYRGAYSNEDASYSIGAIIRMAALIIKNEFAEGAY